MKVKFILPKIVEAESGGYRPIKYSLFPPLGLATLASYLAPGDEAEISDEHVEKLRLTDSPDLVCLEVYATCARRAYAIADSYRARGIYVAMGGLHPTAMPDEAARHADTVVTGPGEGAFPAFLRDFRAGAPLPRYFSPERTLDPFPHPRRDLIKSSNYLVPGCVSLSRGCPHSCNFCYKENFLRGGRGYYRAALEAAVAEVASLPWRHVFFMDDNIFADEKFAMDFFREIAPLKKVWQGAATVKSMRNGPLMDAAAASGAGSLFVGFETINGDSLRGHGKFHNATSEYSAAIRAAHSRGIMINSSFVFGMSGDGPDVFGRTVDWAVSEGLETATFHILTPYPGSALFEGFKRRGELLTENWDLYDTRHCVFRHPRISPERMEEGYWKSYGDFYSWRSIFAGARANGSFLAGARHFAYAASWKKMEFLWRAVIAAKRLPLATPVLESVLRSRSGAFKPSPPTAAPQ